MREMREAGLTPDNYSYNILIGRASEIDDGLQIVGEMKKAGLSPDTYSIEELANLDPIFLRRKPEDL